MTTDELARALIKESRVIAKQHLYRNETVLAALKRAWLAARMFSLQLNVIDGEASATTKREEAP